MCLGNFDEIFKKEGATDFENNTGVHIAYWGSFLALRAHAEAKIVFLKVHKACH